jgi:O-antigen/teichoic acid export membrane protein
VSTDRSSTTRGALVGIGTVVAERAIAFVVVLVLARTLSPTAFGRYGYVLAGMTLIQVLADQGIEVAAIARMSAAPAATRHVLGAALLLRLVVCLAIAVPVGSVLLPLLATGGGDPGLAAAGLASSVLVLVGGSASVRSALRARGAMGSMARVALADAVLGALAVVAVTRAGAGLGAIFGARALASLAVTATAFVAGAYRPSLGSRATVGDLVGVAGPLAGNALLIAIHTRAGHLVAMALAGPTVVGLLGAAARVTEVLGVVPEGALLALFPRMAAGPEDAPALAATAARRLAVPVLALVVALTVGAEPIAILLFGAPYAGAAPAITVLAWIAPLAVTGGVVLHALVARGAERMLVPANVVAALAGVALQVVLVRRFALVGAAAATLATAAIGQLALLGPASTRNVVRRVWRSVLPVVALAAVCAAIGRHVHPEPVGAALAAGAYLLAAIGFGLIEREDWRVLRDALVRAQPDA